MKTPTPSEGRRDTVPSGEPSDETLEDERPTIIDGLRGESLRIPPLRDLAALPRPFAFSLDEEDTEPTRPAAIFSERLAYWHAQDAEFSPAEAEDELPCVLALRKTDPGPKAK
jgi:hypothetical protein